MSMRRKPFKRIVTIVLAFSMVAMCVNAFSIQSVYAKSDRPISEEVSCVVLPDKDMNKIRLTDKYTYSVGNCKSTKKSVASVKGKSQKAYILVRKAGSADLTIKAKKAGSGKYKKYKTTVTAYEYTNPFKTFKIGKKSYKKRYDSSLLYGTTGALKGKVTIKAAAGWKLVRIEKMGPGDDDFVKIENGSSVNIPQMGEVRVTMKHKASGQKVVFSNISM